MKKMNFKTILWIVSFIAVLAVIGLSMSACEEPDPVNGTTWNATVVVSGYTVTYTLTFNSPNYTMTGTVLGQTQVVASGTYSASGSTVTLDSGQQGTISGNTLTFSGASYSFTRQ